METNFSLYSSEGRQVSTAMQEIIPVMPRPIELNTFSFVSEQDCNVIINGNEKISLFAGYGLQLQYNVVIKSFVIEEPNITFFWVGGR